MAIRDPDRRATRRSTTARSHGIGHYFGGGWTPEEKERFAKLLPHERMLAAFDGDAIVGGAGVFPFELTIPGGRLPCAGVTVVGVLPTHRRQGILGRMMRAQLDDIRERGEPLAALWASEETIYGRFGYGLAVAGRDGAGDRASTPSCSPDLPRLDGTTRGSSGHEEALADLPAHLRPRPAHDARGSSRARGTGGSCASSTTARSDGVERASSTACCSRSTAGRPAMRSTGSSSSSRMREREPGARDRGDRRLARRNPRALALPARDRLGATRSSCDLLPADHPLFLLVQRPNHLNWKVFDGLWLRLVDVGAALSAPVARGRRSHHVRHLARPDVPGERRHLDARSRRGRPLAPPPRRPARRAGARVGLPRRLHVRRPGARRPRRGGRRRGGIARADALFRVDAKPWCPEIF